MTASTTVRSRYELREVLNKGGMGVVYHAWDTLMKRDVALKTILDVQNRAAFDLFYKEWGLQASITHPNIIEIYDIGEFEDGGVSRPYFVMRFCRVARWRTSSGTPNSHCPWNEPFKS
jgi:serine/threonine protein kinase